MSTYVQKIGKRKNAEHQAITNEEVEVSSILRVEH